MQTSCISSAHTDDSLSHHSSLTEHKFKDKIIKNFKYDDCRVLKQVWHLLSARLSVTILVTYT